MAKPSIVLVDDEPDILHLVKYHLKRYGAWVETFTSPLEAVSYVRNDQPSLIISDWMMPGMDGIEFCRTVNHYPGTSHIPLMMLTCKNSKVDQQEAFNTGVVDFMVKPISMKELVERVDKVLNQARFQTPIR